MLDTNVQKILINNDDFMLFTNTYFSIDGSKDSKTNYSDLSSLDILEEDQFHYELVINRRDGTRKVYKISNNIRRTIELAEEIKDIIGKNKEVILKENNSRNNTLAIKIVNRNEILSGIFNLSNLKITIYSSTLNTNVFDINEVKSLYKEQMTISDSFKYAMIGAIVFFMISIISELLKGTYYLPDEFLLLIVHSCINATIWALIFYAIGFISKKRIEVLKLIFNDNSILILVYDSVLFSELNDCIGINKTQIYSMNNVGIIQKSDFNSESGYLNLIDQNEKYETLRNLKKLLDEGILSQSEFETEKAKILDLNFRAKI